MAVRREPSPARGRPQRQQGAAALIVVMGLLLVAAMVANYAARNQLFDQRTATHLYRAMQARAAAEAGLEWAMGLLNAGRVDATCRTSDAPEAATFRDRHLRVHMTDRSPDPSVVFEPVRLAVDGSTAALAAACVRDAGGWTCSCPDSGEPVLAPTAADAASPAFRVALTAGRGTGSFVVNSIGCTSADAGCLAGDAPANGNARAGASVVVAVAPALPTAPAAPVTVRGRVDVGGHPWRVVNADAATNGIVVHSGDVFDAPNARLHSAPGSTGAGSVIDRDPSLSAASAEHLFVSTLGVDPLTFANLPSTLHWRCEGDCSAGLRDLVAANPGRPIWLEGDLHLDHDVVIGSPSSPVLLVVAGDVRLATGGTRIHGVIYARATSLALSGEGLIQGAFIAAGNVDGSAAPAVIYDTDAIRSLRLTQGTAVRVPGGWRDY